MAVPVRLPGLLQHPGRRTPAGHQTSCPPYQGKVEADWNIPVAAVAAVVAVVADRKVVCCIVVGDVQLAAAPLRGGADLADPAQ